MNTQSFHRSAVLAAAVAAAGMMSYVVGATAATSDGEPLKEVVAYRDLNLNRPEGISALYQRVSNAAAQVCHPLQSRELSKMKPWKDCVHGAISRAVTQINVPALTAYADARAGHGSSPILTAGGK